ncbi:hypothetical protein ACWCXH_11935 [Kitasatospora sp. NPDC001660]
MTTGLVQVAGEPHQFGAGLRAMVITLSAPGPDTRTDVTGRHNGSTASDPDDGTEFPADGAVPRL